MTRVYATSVGCKVSQADREAALAQLVAGGLRVVGRREDADVCLLMTCCVTAEAERKSRRLARRLAADGRRVLVAGCAATLRAAQFEHPGVEVVDAGAWESLGRALAEERRGAREEEGRAPSSGAAGDGSPETTLAAGAAGRRTRVTLKVQDGCSGACSYCVVRLVRGQPRSTPLRQVVSAAEAAVESGCGEVVLSGVDLGAYRDGSAAGSAPDGAADLADLVRTLADLPGLARLRLSSVEPDSVDDRLLDVLTHPRVARHLHLPLQSADDGVLAAMRRRYTVAEYMRTVERVRSRLDEAMLSTDVIAGFPAEDEAAFERTLAALESGLFGRVHVFAYSSRPGTAAAAMRPLPAGVVRERAKAAGGAAREVQRRAAAAAVGRRAEVLVEEHRDGEWTGYSSQYVRHYLSGTARPGDLVVALADRVYGDGVRGRIDGRPARPGAAALPSRVVLGSAAKDERASS